ncbi:sodium/proton-translocating pyrophosphatase, partial [Flavobacteriales bacterium]|nr:sodium/proton-translocating pyrophosphatase [Flavobacteriales bacterium]
EAAITGDTVGDPFKDTSGPSMNILIKLTCLIGLVIAPILGEVSAAHNEQEPAAEMTIEVEIENENNYVITTNEESSIVTIENKK